MDRKTEICHTCRLLTSGEYDYAIGIVVCTTGLRHGMAMIDFGKYKKSL